MLRKIPKVVNTDDRIITIPLTPGVPVNRAVLLRIVSLSILVGLLAAACATVPEIPETPKPPVDLPLISEDDLVRMHLDSMDLRARIGHRFMIFVPRGVMPDDLLILAGRGVDQPPPEPTGSPEEEDSEIPEAAVTFLKTVEAGNPAGMIVYRWNYEDREDVIRLTTALQTVAMQSQPGRRLLISADQEGGRVAAFRFPDIVRIPSAAAAARHEDPEFIESLAYVTGRELHAMGVNMNLAPVLDLTPIPDSSIIGDRAWGDDAGMAAEFAGRYVRGMTRAGVVTTAKHFPGHGVTRVDSHGRLPIVSYTMDDLRGKELIPFAESIAAGVPVVMTAHILFPEIDPDYPVTISEVFLQDLLREEMGFEGVVISDGLEMGALAANFDIDTTLERAIRSGVDLILLYVRYQLPDVVNRVERMVRDGRLTEADIDTGVERILRLKYRYGLLDSF